MNKDTGGKIWSKFLSKHWKIFALIVAIGIVAIIGAIYIFLWFVGDAQSTNLVPTTLGLWTMGYFVSFILYLILWEILYIGIPVLIVIAAIFFLWWKKLPDEEKKEYKHGHLLFGKRSHRSDAGGGISFLIFIFFIIKIYLDGNWDFPFAEWSFDYLVYSWLTALLVVILIFAIPLGLGAIWWIHSKMKKQT